MAQLFLALIHHPVVNRNGQVVTSAITSLDIHDLARSARTYGVDAFFVVHPIPEQREFAKSVIDHWRFDFGRAFDARRREALELVRIVPTLADACAEAEKIAGTRALIVHTSARTDRGQTFAAMRARLEAPDAPPAIIMLGTGFGMTPEMAERADILLEAIHGATDYNHLSVRAAGAIILDRLRGR
ncbi:MAG TPA: RNA methyltransferase [Candidatus Binataceae bacterium]|nr:RNA methyltransferase [Candidatus Binataceae bacterium]